MSDPGFIDWNNKLKLRMADLVQYYPKHTSAMIDAMIPYRLGWSPDRAARAILRLNRRDHHELNKLSMGDRWKD